MRKPSILPKKIKKKSGSLRYGLCWKHSYSAEEIINLVICYPWICRRRRFAVRSFCFSRWRRLFWVNWALCSRIWFISWVWGEIVAQSSLIQGETIGLVIQAYPDSTILRWRNDIFPAIQGAWGTPAFLTFDPCRPVDIYHDRETSYRTTTLMRWGWIPFFSLSNLT